MHFGGYGVISVWQQHIYASTRSTQLPGRVEMRSHCLSDSFGLKLVHRKEKHLSYRQQLGDTG